MNSLTSQLEATKSNQESFHNKEEELRTTKTELQQCQEKLESSVDELTKLKSEKKLILKHDQV